MLPEESYQEADELARLCDQALMAKDYVMAVNYASAADKLVHSENTACLLARAYLAAGNNTRARAICKRVLHSNPVHRRAREILNRAEGRRFVKCMLCGSDEHEWLAGTCRYDIKVTNVICKKCGLVYVNPRQTKEELEEYYDQIYREQYRVVDIDSEDYRLGKRRKAQVLRRFLPEQGRVLEVGCANGVLLNEIKAQRPDVNIYGIEPTSELAQKVSSTYGVEVFCGMLEDYQVDRQRFDLIIFDHVLEHIDDPVHALGIVRSLLKDAGSVYIEVPDVRQPYGDLEYNFLQNVHLYSYSYKTINLLFKLTGFP